MRWSRLAGGMACALLTTSAVAAQAPPGDVRPFTIRVPDAVLADLKARLANPRFPEPLDGDGWGLGTDIRYLKELVAYWRDRFDWRAQERRLNQFEQFTTEHRRPRHPLRPPAVAGCRTRCRCSITHGWPGSFVEFAKVIGPLTDPVAHGGRAEDAFRRRHPVDSRFRVLGPAARARLRPRAHRRASRPS